MIQTNDRDSGIIIFSTRTNLSLLCDRDSVIFGDGTFKTCPKYFHQMYTLHVYQHNQYVQWAFCLLPSKSEETYRKMFTHLKNICLHHGLNLDIQTLHLDFEKATHNAATAIWSNVAIKGCLFHLRQAWFRKVQTLGLSPDYKNPKSEIGTVETLLWIGISTRSPGTGLFCFRSAQRLPRQP